MTTKTGTPPASFDRNQVIQLRVASLVEPFPICFPTDEQWIEYHKSVRVLARVFGKRIIQDRIVAPGADSALVQLLRSEQGKPLSDKNAQAVVEALIDFKTQGSRIRKDGFEFKMSFLAGFVGTHQFLLPTDSHMQRIKAGLKAVWRGKGVTQIVPDWNALASLYDELISDFHGYSSGVPVLHKMVALSSMGIASVQ